MRRIKAIHTLVLIGLMSFSYVNWRASVLACEARWDINCFTEVTGAVFSTVMAAIAVTLIALHYAWLSRFAAWCKQDDNWAITLIIIGVFALFMAWFMKRFGADLAYVKADTWMDFDYLLFTAGWVIFGLAGIYCILGALICRFLDTLQDRDSLT